jgi:translation initiation factor IF-2
MKQTFEQKDDKKRGPRRPTGGGKKGAEGSLEGSFSMESVAQDRRSERGPGSARPGGRGGPGGGRGGKPGGGRGGPGGGRPGGRGAPGGGRGGKPGGTPKS